MLVHLRTHEGELVKALDLPNEVIVLDGVYAREPEQVIWEGRYFLLQPSLPPLIYRETKGVYVFWDGDAP
jgi:hypothetical protein